ncbi:glycosyltransferase family 2 protein [bacterium]|nr:glycosyltransferase family 2 protein [bacterium]
MDNERLLSVIIPCYNEENLIVEVVRAVSEASLPGLEKEIIIVDDGSTDGTAEVLRSQAEKPGHKIICSPRNRGKGYAVRLGLEQARGKVVIIQDADLEYSASEYYKVVQPVFDGEVQACYGSRFAFSYSVQGAYFFNILANRFLTFLSNLFTGYRLTDMETCFKAVRRDVFLRLRLTEDRFGIEPEITSELASLGCKIKEVPISYSPRLKSEGKKIGFRDGWQSILCILRCGFRLGKQEFTKSGKKL